MVKPMPQSEFVMSGPKRTIPCCQVKIFYGGLLVRLKRYSDNRTQAIWPILVLGVHTFLDTFQIREFLPIPQKTRPIMEKAIALIHHQCLVRQICDNQSHSNR